MGQRAGDRFFTTHKCDRCGGDIGARILSWFTDEVLCMFCHGAERSIRETLPDFGRAYEGCGHVPEKGEGPKP